MKFPKDLEKAIFDLKNLQDVNLLVKNSETKSYFEKLGFKSEEVFKYVVELYENELSEENKSYLAYLLGKLGKKSDAHKIFEFFEKEEYRLVIWELSKSMILIGNKSIAPNLIKMLEEHIEAEKKVSVIYCLGGLGIKSIKNKLLQLLSDKEQTYEVRAESARVLGLFIEQSAIDILLDNLFEDSVILKTDIIYALGQLGNKKAIPYLQKIVAQESLLPKTSKILELAKISIGNIEEDN